VTIKIPIQTPTILGLAMVLAIFGNLGNRKSRKLFYRIYVVILETIYDVIIFNRQTNIVTLAILAMAIDDFSIPFATNRKTKCRFYTCYTY
jgi:hypothetical protein